MTNPVATQHALVSALSAIQQAAAAKLLYATQRPGTLAVVCGPAGTGKSRALNAVARSVEAAGRTCRIMPASEACGARSEGRFDVLMIDDADRIADHRLAGVVEACREGREETSIVLAGTGRLLTLMAREPHLERMVQLRAVLAPFSRTETRHLVASIIGSCPPADRTTAAAVSDTIHEIAGGIPAAIVRVAELAAVVAKGTPGRRLTAADIEAIHGRLGISAA